MDAKQKGLKVIILSQLLIEANDDLKMTTMYKGNIKKFGKAFINQIASHLKQVDAVNAADPEIANNVYNNIDALAERLATLDLTGIILMNQIFDNYVKNSADKETVYSVELERIKD